MIPSLMSTARPDGTGSILSVVISKGEISRVTEEPSVAASAVSRSSRSQTTARWMSQGICRVTGPRLPQASYIRTTNAPEPSSDLLTVSTTTCGASTEISEAVGAARNPDGGGWALP